MKKGFTLIELSIVLVIIGLIIGGILTAQSMVENAKIGRSIKQLQQYEIMFSNYKINYKYLPGDDPVPKSNCSYCYGGDGNGMMGYTYAGWLTWDEQFVAWKDLQAVGFLKNDPNFTGIAGYSPTVVSDPNIDNWVGNILPSFSYDKKVAIIPEAYFMPYWGDPTQAQNAAYQPQCKTLFELGRHISGDQYSNGALTGKAALAMDKKIDDGNASTGHVIANGISPAPAAGKECFTQGNLSGFNPATVKTYNLNSANYACEIFYCLQDN